VLELDDRPELPVDDENGAVLDVSGTGHESRCPVRVEE
jgi:hypothetical protein